MEIKNFKLSNVQWAMQDYDLDSCKMVAQWLARHIKLQETDFANVNATIGDLGLSNRANNVLKINGINSLKELLILASKGHHIQLLKGAGATVTKEIEQKLHKFQNSHIFRSKKLHVY
jgi:DNA-directed RNA polymerase alpha subunit